MRTYRIIGAIAFIAAAAAGTSLAKGTVSSGAASIAIVGDDNLTPAQRAIQIATVALEAGGATAEEYINLAVALSRRARETAEPEWYDRSDDALFRAHELAPHHFVLERQRIWNQLGRHEFEAALVAARTLNQRAKDDALTYGLLVDAAVELGHYAEAEEAAQWMLDLRPGAPAAMTRVSYLREQFGDIPGAVDAMKMAFHSTRPSDSEDRAWILTHLAHLELERGQARLAESYAQQALSLFPDYHYALKELGRAMASQGDLAASITLLERRYAVAPHPENLYELGCAVERGGDVSRAQQLFSEFEAAALTESKGTDNANLELMDYWLDHACTEANARAALALALDRTKTRADLRSLEALAWAQHRAGEGRAAWGSIQKALAIGSQNPRLRYRAGRIALAAGEEAAARAAFEAAWNAAPSSHYGQLAKGQLLTR